MTDQFHIAARPDPWRGGMEVIVRQGDQLASLVLSEVPVGMVCEPTLLGVAGADFLQAALNCAWAAGMRPTGFHDTAEALRATSAHLEDMRAITFNRLGMVKP